MNYNSQAADIDNILKILEDFGSSDVSRLKIDVTDASVINDSDAIASAADDACRNDHVAVSGGESRRQYHHGRCDVGSPWAKGTCENF